MKQTETQFEYFKSSAKEENKLVQRHEDQRRFESVGMLPNKYEIENRDIILENDITNQRYCMPGIKVKFLIESERSLFFSDLVDSLKLLNFPLNNCMLFCWDEKREMHIFVANDPMTQPCFLPAHLCCPQGSIYIKFRSYLQSQQQIESQQVPLSPYQNMSGNMSGKIYGSPTMMNSFPGQQNNIEKNMNINKSAKTNIQEIKEEAEIENKENKGSFCSIQPNDNTSQDRMRKMHTKKKGMMMMNNCINKQATDKRVKERYIVKVKDNVQEWRSIHETGYRDEEGNLQKLNLDQAANYIGISRKTLDDYYLQLRRAEQLGFDFELNKGEKMGTLRKFVKEQSILLSKKSLPISSKLPTSTNIDSEEDVEDPCESQDINCCSNSNNNQTNSTKVNPQTISNPLNLSSPSASLNNIVSTVSNSNISNGSINNQPFTNTNSGITNLNSIMSCQTNNANIIGNPSNRGSNNSNGSGGKNFSINAVMNPLLNPSSINPNMCNIGKQNQNAGMQNQNGGMPNQNVSMSNQNVGMPNQSTINSLVGHVMSQQNQLLVMDPSNNAYNPHHRMSSGRNSGAGLVTPFNYSSSGYSNNTTYGYSQGGMDSRNSFGQQQPPFLQQQMNSYYPSNQRSSYMSVEPMIDSNQQHHRNSGNGFNFGGSYFNPGSQFLGLNDPNNVSGLLGDLPTNMITENISNLQFNGAEQARFSNTFPLIQYGNNSGMTEERSSLNFLSFQNNSGLQNQDNRHSNGSTYPINDDNNITTSVGNCRNSGSLNNNNINYPIPL